MDRDYIIPIIMVLFFILGYGLGFITARGI